MSEASAAPVIDTALVDEVPHAAMVNGTSILIDSDNTLDLGSCYKVSSREVVVDRSYANRVPAEKHSLLTLVPHHERPNPSQSLKAPFPIFVVRSQNKRRIRRQVAPVSSPSQAAPKFFPVMNITVERNEHIPVTANYGLFSRRPSADRIAPNSEEEVLTKMTAFSVRAAMSQTTERGQVALKVLVNSEWAIDTDDATHDQRFSTKSIPV